MKPIRIDHANILAWPLIEMAKDIRRKIQPGGLLILSGFTENQENDVRVAYRRQDHHLVRKQVSDGWSTFVLARFGGKRYNARVRIIRA